MLESVKFLLEKIKTCRDNCSYPRSCWWLCRILTSPISLIGLLFVQMGMLMKYCENKLENMMEKGEITDKDNSLVFCPTCEAPVYMREKRPNGDDICANGHKYPSIKTVPKE